MEERKHVKLQNKNVYARSLLSFIYTSIRVILPSHLGDRVIVSRSNISLNAFVTDPSLITFAAKSRNEGFNVAGNRCVPSSVNCLNKGYLNYYDTFL